MERRPVSQPENGFREHAVINQSFWEATSVMSGISPHPETPGNGLPNTMLPPDYSPKPPLARPPAPKVPPYSQNPPSPRVPPPPLLPPPRPPPPPIAIPVRPPPPQNNFPMRFPPPRGIPLRPPSPVRSLSFSAPGSNEIVSLNGPILMQAQSSYESASGIYDSLGNQSHNSVRCPVQTNGFPAVPGNVTGSSMFNMHQIRNRVVESTDQRPKSLPRTSKWDAPVPLIIAAVAPVNRSASVSNLQDQRVDFPPAVVNGERSGLREPEALQGATIANNKSNLVRSDRGRLPDRNTNRETDRQLPTTSKEAERPATKRNRSQERAINKRSCRRSKSIENQNSANWPGRRSEQNRDQDQHKSYRPATDEIPGSRARERVDVRSGMAPTNTPERRYKDSGADRQQIRPGDFQRENHRVVANHGSRESSRSEANHCSSGTMNGVGRSAHVAHDAGARSCANGMENGHAGGETHNPVVEPNVLQFLESKEFYESIDASTVTATPRLADMHQYFRLKILDELDAANTKREEDETSDSSEDSSTEKDGPSKSPARGKPVQRKPPKRCRHTLHPDLLFNARNKLNDGKACKCNKVLRGYGIKHGHLVGDDQQKFTCAEESNNGAQLFCYRMILEPVINFTSSLPTKVRHNRQEFCFRGFCLLSHQRLLKYPAAQSTRFNVAYTMTLEEIPVPKNFVIRDLNLFRKYFFKEIMELKDWRMKAESLEKDPKICDSLHFFPLFGRIASNSIEIAPMSAVLDHVIGEFRPLFTDDEAEWLRVTSNSNFEDHVQRFRGALAVCPGRKPAVLRVDQVDKDTNDLNRKERKDKIYPALVHFTTRSSCAVDPNLYKMQKKLEHLRGVLETRPKHLITPEEKMRLREQQNAVDELARKLKTRKEVTVVLSSRGFFHTGLRSDVAQYGLLVPWVAFHVRYHISLDLLEQKLDYTFNDRNLLELALTHPSYRCNMGTNPDHIRNAQANLGSRKAAYGQLGVIPKSGMKTLIHTMAQLGVEDEMASPIKNYERLEFLGDAVLEFLTSMRLFLVFRDIQEGGLATFRATLVQNNHLAILAEEYNLSHFLLISHGREMSSRKRITDKHAAANCFEAVCGAIYLDGGIKFVDDLFSRALASRLFAGDPKLQEIWRWPPPYISPIDYPNGDRHLIERHELLQRVAGFEEITGIRFHHIRLLANAFSSRQVHENTITIGNNQRLEFLGDTVLQLIVSDHLFKHFPKHHEGHLSLLRSSLVSNKTQAYVCEELTMGNFYIREQGTAKNIPPPEIKLKDRADLVEAYLGALYLDQGLTVCQAFCKIVFFPKLTDFIVNQSWSDPKSRLQQCCLTLRSVDGSTPKLPEYKVINKLGPSNNRIYDVAVYFNGERLATGSGSNSKQAEEAAAEAALKNPVFLPDFQRQQNFAKRAVAAQKAKGHFNNSFSNPSAHGRGNQWPYGNR